MSTNRNLTELSSFIADVGDPGKLIVDLAATGSKVSQLLDKAGLTDILGESGAQNVSGDEVKKLDLIANELFIADLKAGNICCGVGSEENEKVLIFEDRDDRSYLVLMDPLDGSSNIDVNVPVGTIFSIFKKENEGPCSESDFYQKGSKQIAAGYLLYGTSTMLVFSSGEGVNGFTMDKESTKFFLSHPKIQTPESGKTYSINHGYFDDFSHGVKEYIRYCGQTDEETNRPYSSRYVGSMVSDFHRNLLKGGIFMYPDTGKNPNGKLRLLYECNPLAFISEQAGGMAVDGSRRILDITPSKLHQTTPVFIGSANMVKKAMEFQTTGHFSG